MASCYGCCSAMEQTLTRASKPTPSSASNSSLHAAKQAKNDEFYTQLTDIERELRHYKDYFNDKVVLCNCDDPEWSNFYKYFSLNFARLGLKKLITTHYSLGGKPAYALEFSGEGKPPQVLPLKGDGDFRSEEAIELLKQADVVVTNPPFSLFREYVEQLVAYNKQFLIIGNKNAITYKEVFTLIQRNKLWVGAMPMGRDMLFGLPDEAAKKMMETGKEGSNYRVIAGKVYGRAPSIWFTNIDNRKRHEEITPYRAYTGNESKYPKYDNYDAIEVCKVVDIPLDYPGCMGVPITFLDKYNPEQFAIVKFRKGDNDKDLTIGGKPLYFRIIIKKKAYEN